MNLSECTKQEVNMQVANIQYPGSLVTAHPNGESVIVAEIGKTVSIINWIDDDALAFRLMVDNCMDYESYYQGFPPNLTLMHLVVGSSPDMKIQNKNPNRAIAECFILMNQGGDK